MNNITSRWKQIPWHKARPVLEKAQAIYNSAMERSAPLRARWSAKASYWINKAVGDDPALQKPRSVLWIAGVILSVFLLWSYFAVIDEVTRAPGQVIASSRTQLIQSQDGGILEDLLVEEGDTVEKEQVLARIDRTRVAAAYEETRSQVAALTARVERLQAELFGVEPEFSPIVQNYPDFVRNQRKLWSVRQTALEEELSSLVKIRNLIQQELEMNKPLLELGDVSMTEVLRLERQAADYAAQITNKRNKYIQDVQAELSKAREELTANEQLLTQRKYMLEQTELRAPMKGIVKNVKITTLGGVIKPGEDIMQIVPLEDNLQIEAKVRPADIGFLRLGMATAIKIDAYDPSIYGDLPGELIFISADTIDEELRQGEEPYYRVRVKAKSRQFSGRPDEDLDIQPGMTATAEIKTGERTVLQYLSKPVTKTLANSMGER
jgi:adhesin transport system membrane fusion protein